MNFKKALYIFLLIAPIFIILQIFRGDSFSIGDIFGTNDVIVIDPGHGGHDPGTIGINNTYEKDINLEISKKLYERLKSMDYKVILTRDTDEYIHNMERIELANKKKAKIFISIHCNALDNDNKTNGVQVLYYPNEKSDSADNDQDSESLAQIMLDDILANTGAVNKGIVERKNLIVLNQANVPAILIECGFLSSKKESALLITDEYQNKIVNGIVNGLEKYLNF